MSTNQPLLRPALLTSMAAGAALLLLQPAASAATLVHRYTFNADAVAGTTYDNGDGTFTLFVTNVTDLVGGTAWNGTLPNGGLFTNVINGTVTNGQVSLVTEASQYVQFPPGIISNLPALTVDAWATISNPWGFLWAFGDTRPSDGFGGNAVWLHCRARLTITDTMPSWGGEQNAFFDPLDNRGYVHITGVVDPPTQRLVVYTNGMLAGISTSETRSLTNVYSIYNYIAKSVFSGDGLIPITIDEFRIWNGALNGVEVAGADVAGPDRIGSAGDVGTLTNLTVTAPRPRLIIGGNEVVGVTGIATLFTNKMTIDNKLCTFTSSDPTLLKVDAGGRVSAGMRVGSATITASYGGMSGSVLITTFAEPAVLAHRYSFGNTDDGAGNLGALIADSVGGTNWDGTLPNGGVFAGGQLFMQGASQQYVNLPTNLFSGFTNVTFDLWVTPQAGLPWNAWLFGFGDTINNDHGAYYFFVQPQSGRFAMAGLDPGWMGEQAANARMDFSGQTNLHLTCVACPAGGYLALYTNGVLADVYSSLSYPLSSIHDNLSYINRSLYPPDPYVDLTINEFRIYSGAMSAELVAANHAAGPDALGVIPPTLGVALAGGNVILSWPTNYAGFTLLSKARLDSGTWAPTGATPVVAGANYQVALPATNSPRFFRLAN